MRVRAPNNNYNNNIKRVLQKIRAFAITRILYLYNMTTSGTTADQSIDAESDHRQN